jgi:signal transducing adaptor molecule
LKEIDPARGDRLDDKPEVEVSLKVFNVASADGQAMYQDSVKLQGQINALIKKYSDQKGKVFFTVSIREPR